MSVAPVAQVEGESSTSEKFLLEYKFPEVLLRSPRCLIALSGLDITNNAIHRLVWEEFSSGRRTDRKPILFKNVAADHLYPKCRTNRSTYEDYSLQGILKTLWLHKHCEELPSLVAFFFDLDWNDPQWDEKQTECVSKVEVIRSALQNRGTEIVIVLLQSSPPLPVGEASNINSERAAALCVACELPRLNLFALPFTQRPQGFISKIEEAFYKKAILYYSNKIHTIRAHKDMITNSQSLQLLFIRHDFKMAFFAEMKHEPTTALKLYRTAYTHLIDNMYLSDDRIMEFKMVAGFISYKICRLCFESDEPLDAITQFRKHIDRFSVEAGMKQLAYEHYEWLSRQFSAFAELFSEALRRGLKGLQTQNPGLYYHQAALYAIQRKQIAHHLTIESNNPQFLPNLPHTIYYGQRPWRKSLTDDKPSNMELRKRCILTMQNQEKAVEHSWQIIPLLTQATSHLKSYGCERMITSLKVLMADEYCFVNDYEKSFVLLNGVVEVYRTEQWWDNLTAVLLRLLRYVYLLGFAQEYVAIGLEVISRYFPIRIEEKKWIQTNLTEVLSSQSPFPEEGLSGDDLQRANVKWAEFFQNCPSRAFTIQLSTLAGCVECKSVFKKSNFMADELVEVKVHLCSSALLRLDMSKLVILFVKEEYNSMCIHDDDFTLEPNVVKTFAFSFPSLSSSVGSNIEIYAVEALLKCTGKMVSPTLIWSNGASENFGSQPAELSWQKIELENKTRIQPRLPHISIFLDHSNPALTGEYYDVTLDVINQEASPITNLSIKVSLPEYLDEAEPHVEIYDSPPNTPFPSQPTSHHIKRETLDLTCSSLEGKEDKFTKKFYLCSQGTGTKKIDVTVTYEVACHVSDEWDSVTCVCHKHHSEVLEVVKPFDLVYKLMTTKFKLTDSINYSSPFILMTEISCTSPWQLLIVESKLELGNNIQTVGENVSQVEGCELNPKDSATDCYCLLAMNTQQSTVSLGTYTVKWKRSTSVPSQVLTSTVSFPPITAKYQTYTVSADIPAYGQLMSVLPVSYTIHNKSALIQEFEAKMGASDAFMYSGNRTSKFRILPSSMHTFTYNLLPVITGLVSLPHVDLICQRDSEKGMTSLISNDLPTSILIKPSPTSTAIDLDLSLISC